jgi:hypothetical protein
MILDDSTCVFTLFSCPKVISRPMCFASALGGLSTGEMSVILTSPASPRDAAGLISLAGSQAVRHPPHQTAPCRRTTASVLCTIDVLPTRKHVGDRCTPPDPARGTKRPSRLGYDNGSPSAPLTTLRSCLTAMLPAAGGIT